MADDPESAIDPVDEIQEGWKRELPEAPVDSIGVITRIWWAGKLLADERRRTLAVLGIDTATLDLLATLRRRGKPYRMTPGELAAASLVTGGAITQRVERARERGLVTSRSSASGYHTQAVTLTAAGNRLVELRVRELLEHESDLIAHLDAAEQQQLAHLLRKLLRGLTERPAADIRPRHPSAGSLPDPL